MVGIRRVLAGLRVVLVGKDKDSLASLGFCTSLRVAAE